MVILIEKIKHIFFMSFHIYKLVERLILSNTTNLINQLTYPLSTSLSTLRYKIISYKLVQKWK